MWVEHNAGTNIFPNVLSFFYFDVLRLYVYSVVFQVVLVFLLSIASLVIYFIDSS